MSGMNKEMSRHFETVIKLRFDQSAALFLLFQQITRIRRLYMRNSSSGRRLGDLTI